MAITVRFETVPFAGFTSLKFTDPMEAGACLLSLQERGVHAQALREITDPPEWNRAELMAAARATAAQPMLVAA